MSLNSNNTTTNSDAILDNIADYILSYVSTGIDEAVEDYKNYLQYLKCFNTEGYLAHKQQLFDNLQPDLQPNLQPDLQHIENRVKRLIYSTDIYLLSAKELLERYLSCNLLATFLATHHATISRQAFSKSVLRPAIEQGFICMLYPDTPNNRNQKYRLTEKGLMVLKLLRNTENEKEDEV